MNQEYRLTPRDVVLLNCLANLGPDGYIEINSSTSGSVHYLRKIMGKRNIVTANGVGYRVTDEGRRRAREILKRIANE